MLTLIGMAVAPVRGRHALVATGGPSWLALGIIAAVILVTIVALTISAHRTQAQPRVHVIHGDARHRDRDRWAA